MDFLREIVGGPKNRYREKGYNLDLTYITPRIIAMAFPASGIQKLYRNNIDTIAQLLEVQHQGKYLTINISGRPINEEILKNVISYQWEDHKAPPFNMLFTICDQVAQFLSGDDDRVAVFHCNHGKGRTGTIICCFFLFMGIFQNEKEVMDYYARKRFEKEGYGVTQPCQIQYIRYFHEFLGSPKLYPQILSIKKIVFCGDFGVSEPYVKLINNGTKELIYNTNQIENVLELQKSKSYTIRFNKKHCFVGDVTLEIKQKKPLGGNLLISYVFNTAFLLKFTEQSKLASVSLKQMSPLGKQKQTIFGSDFSIQIEFRKHCNCGENKNIEGCKRCNGILKEEFFKWQQINIAFRNRELLLPNRQLICFGTNHA